MSLTLEIRRVALLAFSVLMWTGGWSHSSTASAATGCGFNVDGLGGAGANGSADITSDGLLLVRYAQGLTGSALIAGTRVDQTPANLSTVVGAINTHMNTYSTAHDMDASGGGISVNNATIMARYLAGYRGAPLVAGLTLTGSRVLATDLEAYIVAGCPTNTLPLSCVLTGATALIIGGSTTVNAACTSNGAPVTGLSLSWAVSSQLSIASGCVANTTSCSVNAVTAGAATVSLSANKAGYAAASTVLNIAVGLSNGMPQIGAVSNDRHEWRTRGSGHIVHVTSTGHR